jgi:hypothetical protein
MDVSEERFSMAVGETIGLGIITFVLFLRLTGEDTKS